VAAAVRRALPTGYDPSSRARARSPPVGAAVQIGSAESYSTRSAAPQDAAAVRPAAARALLAGIRAGPGAPRAGPAVRRSHAV